MYIVSWLLAALLLCDLCVDTSLGAKIYKSRKRAMTMLSGSTEETQQYFSSCEQSSNEESCQMAMDSDLVTDWTQCANTDPERGTASWWRGYLEYPIYVATVHIQNANWENVGETDGTMEFTISGSGDVCYTHSDRMSFSSRSFPCDILADDIEIKTLIDGAVLSLCEVQVYGVQLNIPSVLHNTGEVITFSDCAQSSVEKSRNCWYGSHNKNKDRRGSTCAMTEAVKFEWWMVTFDIPALVRRVVLYNRIDCCPSPSNCCKGNMTDFEVTVGSRRCGRYNDRSIFSSKDFTCNQFGGDVKIQGMTNAEIVVCGIEVFGHLVQMTPEQKRNEIGCFVDRQEDPDLGDFKEPVSMSSMTVEKCDKMCRRLKKKYFGLQDGFQCWCGSSYGKYGKVADTECRKECEGKRADRCGNVNRTLVYELF